MLASPATMSVIANPVMIHNHAEITTGVTRTGPSHVRPRKGSAKFCAGNRTA
jgi:hypothetical protein